MSAPEGEPPPVVLYDVLTSGHEVQVTQHSGDVKNMKLMSTNQQVPHHYSPVSTTRSSFLSRALAFFSSNTSAPTHLLPQVLLPINP